MAGGVHAAEWRITPSIQVVEEYSDNVVLVPADQRQSDFISQINPSLTLDVHGPRADFQGKYTIQNVIYARERDRNNSNNLLAAGGKGAIIQDWLFLEGQADIDRQSVSGQDLRGIDPNTDNRNTTESRTYRVSPYIRDRIGGALTYEVRYQRDHASTDSPIVPTSDANLGHVSIRSGTDFTRSTWGIEYNKESVRYSLGEQSTSAEYFAANGRYLIDPQFGFLATVGHEKNDYVFTGQKPEGPVWNAGFVWQPSLLSSLTATGGKRFFGKTYALDFTHRTRSFLWSAQYNENIGAARDQFLAEPKGRTAAYVGQLAGADIADPIERARFVDNFILTNGLPANFFTASNSRTNRNFLEKRLDGLMTYNTAKTTSVLNIFRVDRDADAIGSVETVPGTDDVQANVNVVQTGASALVNWRFSTNMALDFSLGGDQYRFKNVTREDKLKFVRLGFHYKLRPKITTAINVRHVERDSTDPNSIYRENAITAAILAIF